MGNTCNQCKESVKSNALKCPHCRSTQYDHPLMLGAFLGFGVLGLPLTAFFIWAGISVFTTTNPLLALVAGGLIGVGLVPPLLLLLGFGGAVNRLVTAG